MVGLNQVLSQISNLTNLIVGITKQFVQSNSLMGYQNKLDLKAFIPLNQIDIMLISESHFYTNKHFFMHNYHFYHTMHPDGTAYGGNAITK